MAAVLVVALFTRLGFWQLDRMHQKQAMLAAVAQVLDRREARPLNFAADPARAHGYDWAAGDGAFADAPPVLLDNQQRDGRQGVRAYRLLQPAAGGTPLLVELGWLPLYGDRRMPEVRKPSGTVHLEGLLLPPPAVGISSSVAEPQPGGAWLVVSLNPGDLASTLKVPAVAMRVLRPDPAARIGYARDVDILPNTLPPERHLGYAVQWFALALAVLATALVLTFRKSRK